MPRVLSTWIVVRVKQGRERYAARNVRRQGHRAFAPYVGEEDTIRQEALFPGYIFVEGPDWYYLQSTYGCLYPLMMGDDPAYMPIKEMRKLLKAADEEGVITIGKEKFTPGQHVKVKLGAWQGFEGVYIRGTPQQRVRVLFKLLGGEHELEFNRTDITSSDDGSVQGNSDQALVGSLTKKQRV